MRPVDFALQAAEFGRRVHPLVPGTKRPLLKKWQKDATANPDTIAEWFAQSPSAGYGIVTGYDIFVVDLDGLDAIEWWSGFGFSNDAEVLTPSGGKHVYFHAPGADIQTNASKVHPGVDIRGEGGYVVGPGVRIETGEYVGDIRNIPDAPDDLLAMLPKRSDRNDNVIEFQGPQVEAASPDEERKLRTIVEALRSLPSVWAPGAGWHDVVFRSACWLKRMVNSPAYALTDDQAASILLENTPTYPDWAEDKIIEQWLSAGEQTAGQHEELPSTLIPPLLPEEHVFEVMPDFTTRGTLFLDLLTKLPDVKTDGALWEARHQIILEMLKAGRTEQEALTAAWVSASARSFKIHEEGALTKLWREVEKASTEVEKQRGDGVEAAPIDLRPPLVVERAKLVSLLSKKERLWLDEKDGIGNERRFWWGERYMQWAASRVRPLNAPYHRMNRWTLLSLVLAPMAIIRLGAKKVGLTFFQFNLGESSTGKSEAKDLLRESIEACFGGDDNPVIGSSTSPNALIDKLIERDGKPSMVHVDEATSMVRDLRSASGSWTSGLKELLLELFDGRVPMILRNGKKDLSGIDARTYFALHLTSVESKITDAIDAELWEDGFLPRFVFALGDPPVDDPEADKVNLLRGELAHHDDPIPAQWATEFANIKRTLEMRGSLPLPMDMTPEAEKRHNVFIKDTKAFVLGHKHADRLKPAQTRFVTNILKCAALVALTERSTVIELRHELIAIEQAEEWWANTIHMVDATDESPEVRRVNKLERMIASRPDQTMALEKIHLESPHDKRTVERLIEQLVAEGRVERKNVEGVRGRPSEVVQLKVAA